MLLQRNASGSSNNTKKNASTVDLTDKQTTTKTIHELSKTVDFAKIKMNALSNTKTKPQTNLTSLELKPATVEGNKSV